MVQEGLRGRGSEKMLSRFLEANLRSDFGPIPITESNQIIRVRNCFRPPHAIRPAFGVFSQDLYIVSLLCLYQAL